MDVSIVTGTFNRLLYLQHMVDSVRVDAMGLAYEIVVVDAGSTDGTQEWLAEQKDVVVVQQGELLGAVRAFNAGFAKACGEYVFSVNDDALVHPPVIRPAIAQLRGRVGQVAIPYSVNSHWIGCQSVRIRGRDYLYANFGIIRRSLGDRLGWWGNGLYHHYAGDTHLSMSVWAAGYLVERLNGDGYIEHLEAQDGTRRGNVDDAQRFFDYWNGTDEPWPDAVPA